MRVNCGRDGRGEGRRCTFCAAHKFNRVEIMPLLCASAKIGAAGRCLCSACRFMPCTLLAPTARWHCLAIFGEVADAQLAGCGFATCPAEPASQGRTRCRAPESTGPICRTKLGTGRLPLGARGSLEYFGAPLKKLTWRPTAMTSSPAWRFSRTSTPARSTPRTSRLVSGAECAPRLI